MHWICSLLMVSAMCVFYVSLCVFVCLPVAIIIVTTFFCRQITVVYVCACASTAWKATSCNIHQSHSVA